MIELLLNHAEKCIQTTLNCIHLITEPISTIVGGPDMYINTGSTVNLTCIVQHSPEPPPSICWTHNNQVSSFLFSLNKKLSLKSHQSSDFTN